MQADRPTGLGGAELALSKAQSGIWYARRLDTDSQAYHTATYVDIRGPVDTDRLASAVRTAIAETEALHLRVVERDGQPRQRVDYGREWTVERIDLSDRAHPESDAHGWMRSACDRPGERAAVQALLRLGPGRTLWYLRVDHIAMDGYGVDLFLRRAAARYRGDEPPPLASLAAVLAEEEASTAAAERARGYWTRRYGDLPSTSPLGARRGSRPGAATRRRLPITAERRDAIASLARQARATPAAVLVAAAAAYTHRVTGDADAVVLLPAANRPTLLARAVPSMTSTVLPLRLPVSGPTRFVDLVARASTEILRALRHQSYGVEDLRRDLGLVASGRTLRGPVVNVVPLGGHVSFGDCDATVHCLSNGPVEDLSLTVYGRPDSWSVLDVDTNSAVHTSVEARAHTQRLAAVLGSALDDPDRRLDQLGLLSLGERAVLLTLATAGGQARSRPSATVLDRLAETTGRVPDQIAVRAAGTAISYRELARRSDRLAAALIRRGVGPERVVAVALPRSVDLVTAVVAVLKSGATYLPIDSDAPAAHVAALLADADPVAVVATETHDLASTCSAPIVRYPADLPPGATVRCPATPGTGAYLMYTSGSTGRPKGVLVQHGSLANLGDLLAELVARPDGARLRLAHVAPFSFDASWDPVLLMMAGHELHIADDEIRREPERLVEFLVSHRIDYLETTPSYLRHLLDAGLLDRDEHSLAVLAVGAEPVDEQLWQRLRDHDGLTAHNFYGPTECTVDAVVGGFADCADVVIGTPVKNTAAYVLGGDLDLVPVGTAGELHIAGAGVARGYHGQPGLTAERFVPDPFGPPGSRMYRTGDIARWTERGQLQCLGRADDQVKIRGVRVEPGAVESALRAHPGVRDVAVVARPDRFGDNRLVAYVVGDGQAAELARHASLRLPPHLVPALLTRVDRLPLTRSGKLDRAALPDPDFAGAASAVAPRDPVEAALCGIFADLLGVTSVSVTDDFFDLGGHSLLATRLIGRVRAECDVRLRLREVFDNPTAARLAALVARKGARA